MGQRTGYESGRSGKAVSKCERSIIMQCVVRTYIDKYTNPTSSLSRKLREGYKVLMVNRIGSGDYERLEYILEKKENEQMQTIQP